MQKTSFIFLSLICGIAFLSACKDDEPENPIIPNEAEVITTLRLTLVPEGGGDTVVLTFQDLDGDGGDPPIISDGVLQTGTVYNGSVELLNELTNPAENITEEVAEEAEAHQFFYLNTISNFGSTYMDADINGNPIGIETLFGTVGAASGTLTVILRHEPDKFAAGVSEGNITNAGGETDIEVSFNVEVQ